MTNQLQIQLPSSNSQTLLSQLSSAVRAESEYHFKQGIIAGAKLVRYLVEQEGLTMDEAVQECENNQNYPIMVL